MHLFDERVIVDFDVDVDGSAGKCLKNLSEQGDARVLSPLAETLCTEKHKVQTAPVWTQRSIRRRALTRKLQHDSLARSICVRVPFWKVTPSLQRYEGSCCKEHKTKGHLHRVRLEPSEDVEMRLM